MNPVQASRVQMMLAAGKHRVAVKESRRKETHQLENAERVLARYIATHGPLNHRTPAKVLAVARLVANHRAMVDQGYFKAPEPLPKRDPTEHRTRRIEAEAADPEKVERERAAERRRRNEFWFNYTETSHFDKANEALREDRLDHLPAGAPDLTGDALHRFRTADIWMAVRNADRADEINRLHLRQEDRIANARNRGRVRGVGAAARRAGF